MDPVARKFIVLACAAIGIALGLIVMVTAHGAHAQLEAGGGIIAAAAGVFVASV